MTCTNKFGEIPDGERETEKLFSRTSVLRPRPFFDDTLFIVHQIREYLSAVRYVPPTDNEH